MGRRSVPSGAARSLCEKLSRRDDRNVAERVHVAQVRVAADKDLRFPVDCQFEEFVVFRVAALGHTSLHSDHLGHPRQREQEVRPSFLVEVADKLGRMITSRISANVAANWIS